MPRCCVCRKEAEHLSHGLWWCERHYKKIGGEEKQTSTPSRTKKETLVTK